MSIILHGAMAHAMSHLANITPEQRAYITAAWVKGLGPTDASITGIDPYLVVICFAALSFAEAETFEKLTAI